MTSTDHRLFGVFRRPGALSRSRRLRSLLRLGLLVIVAQALFWGLFNAPWGPRPAMRAIDRIGLGQAELAELKTPTASAADAALHRPVDLPHTDCCDPAYLSLRIAFTLKQVPEDGLGLVAFQQVDNFIIRVNGSIVHRIGEMEFGRQTFHGQRPWLVHLPAGLLRTGENQLSFVTVRHGYPYTDLVPPLMGSYEQVRAATALRFWQSLEFRALGGWLTLVLGLMAFIMVFRSQDRRFALWLSALCWSWTAFAAYGLVFDLPFGGGGRMMAFFLVNSLLGTALLGFIDAWTRRPVPGLQAGLVGIWLVFNGLVAVGLATLPVPSGFDLSAEAWAWFSFVAGLAVMARLIGHFALVNEDRHLEAALLSICAVCLMLDGIGERFGLLAGGYMIDAAPLLLLAFFVAFLQRNFTLFRSAMGLNALLEERLEAREAELVQAHERERELVDRQARSEERRRLMRDMHDGVGGQLVGLLLTVRRGVVEPQKIVEGLQGAMDEIRLMIDSVDARGTSLAAMLEVFETRVRPRVEGAGLRFRWRNQVDGGVDLPPQVGLQVFRIMQEAVTNALKHSGGERIEVTVAVRSGGELRVTVADNGQGTDAGSGVGQGHGLGNMRARALAVGGRLAIEAAEPGTRVVLTVPLAGHEADSPPAEGSSIPAGAGA